MQEAELQLFNQDSVSQEILKSEASVTPIIPDTQSSPTLTQAFGELLQDPAELTKTAKARQILGEGGKSVTDEQLESFVAKIEYLLTSWLDSYERQIFNGKTLREISKSNTP